jgi:hypothetical protein
MHGVHEHMQHKTARACLKGQLYLQELVSRRLESVTCVNWLPLPDGKNLFPMGSQVGPSDKAGAACWQSRAFYPWEWGPLCASSEVQNGSALEASIVGSAMYSWELVVVGCGALVFSSAGSQMSVCK